MSRIKNHYTYLITNNAAGVDRGWLEDYIEFTGEVDKIRRALNRKLEIQDKATYAGTRFESARTTHGPAFAEHLLYKKANGIASRGQSVLSEENFQRFIAEPEFVTALCRIDPRPEPGQCVVNTGEAWEQTRQKHGAKANPLLINRTVRRLHDERDEHGERPRLRQGLLVAGRRGHY